MKQLFKIWRLISLIFSIPVSTHEVLEVQNGRPSIAAVSSFVEDLLANPRATLFNGQNYTGESIEYNSKEPNIWGSCYPLRSLRGTVKSIKTYGKCVRVFYYANCAGWSLAIYPSSGNAEILNHNLKYIWSIGPCLPNEFENSYFQDPLMQYIAKNASDPSTYTPDQITFYNEDKLSKSTILLNSTNPIRKYLLGPNNRLEFIESQIFLKHLNVSQYSTTLDEAEMFKSADKQQGDIVGYAITPSLGGPVNETFNQFLQSPSSQETWGELTSSVHKFMEHRNNSSVIINLDFHYENAITSRPYAFIYYIGYQGDKSDILYGRVAN